MALPLVDDHASLAPEADASDWRSALRTTIRTEDDLAQHLTLTPEERAGFAALREQGGLPLGITRHFLSLMDTTDPRDPLRRQVVPRAHEWDATTWDRRDPLGEEDHEVVPYLVHRYPDRVLLLATDRCGSYCRFCTRKRLVGQGPTPTTEHLDAALAYVASHQEIHEVIVSGGDALLFSDEQLERLLARIRAIAHVEIIRLATRMPVFVPTRITDALVQVMKAHQPVYVLTHINHPRELAPATCEAIARLVDGGVPVLNQTVLMRGVNDDRDVLMALFRALTRLRARPYYLHQCDLAPGTEEFRVPLEEARALYASLRGHLSGMSIPTFVIDIPGGLGKAPWQPDAVVSEDADGVVLRGFRGKLARYPKR